mmetsp:Transcript_9274/g.26520  ORF Transcript_9274/g.26520 Transcript_9274/m.26520 type:complete len:213 (-) Transcript_9274:2677-3315(-)
MNVQEGEGSRCSFGDAKARTNRALYLAGRRGPSGPPLLYCSTASLGCTCPRKPNKLIPPPPSLRSLKPTFPVGLSMGRSTVSHMPRGRPSLRGRRSASVLSPSRAGAAEAEGSGGSSLRLSIAPAGRRPGILLLLDSVLGHVAVVADGLLAPPHGRHLGLPAALAGAHPAGPVPAAAVVPSRRRRQGRQRRLLHRLLLRLLGLRCLGLWRRR